MIGRSVMVAGTGGIIAGVIGWMWRTVKFGTGTGHSLATRHVMLMMKRMHLKKEKRVLLRMRKNTIHDAMYSEFKTKVL